MINHDLLAICSTELNLTICWCVDFNLCWQVLIDNIEEYAPIVYTPTVGLVCQNYSGLFRRPRGMYFSAEDRGEMMSMVYNWPSEQVRSTRQFCSMFYDMSEVSVILERVILQLAEDSEIYIYINIMMWFYENKLNHFINIYGCLN